MRGVQVRPLGRTHNTFNGKSVDFFFSLCDRLTFALLLFVFLHRFFLLSASQESSSLDTHMVAIKTVGQ